MKNNHNYIKFLPHIEKDKCLLNKEIIIFGLGKNGKRTIEFALNHNYKIIEIWDNSVDITNYNDIKICKPHGNYDKNIPIIITVMLKKVKTQLYNQCKSLGYINILNSSELYIDENLTFDEYKKHFYDLQAVKIEKILDSKDNSFILKSVDLQITEKCSLKCKECSNLMQYFEKPQDLVFDEVIKDLDKLLSVVDYIEEVRILGGEPFVCKDFAKYINSVKKYKNIGSIVVYTNATVAPKGENLECLKYPNIYLKISNYGDALSRNLNKLIDICDKNNILYGVDNMDYWFRCASLDKHNRTDEENKKVLKNCCMEQGPSIRNGLFFRCPFIANAWALKAIPKNDIEYIDLTIDDKVLLREKIKNYMEQEIIVACDYCLGRPIDSQGKELIPVAEQTKQPLKYHKYE